MDQKQDFLEQKERNHLCNKRYRENNPEKIRKSQALWSKNNPEKCRAKAQKYYYKKMKDPEFRQKRNENRRLWHLKTGRTKCPRRTSLGLKPISRKDQQRIYKYRLKTGYPLTIENIQKVYEDNIKKFGTLTCQYCLKPIEFGDDALDHKHPVSRGGTNYRKNLAVAHISCNCSKQNKTVREFRNYLKKKGGDKNGYRSKTRFS